MIRMSAHFAFQPRMDAPKILRERLPRDFGQRAGELNTRRPAADDDEGQKPALRVGIVLPLGRFEREQHTPPDVQRIVQRLQPRRP